MTETKQWYSSWALKNIISWTLAIMARLNASPIKGHLGIVLRNKSGMGIRMISPKICQGLTVIIMILDYRMLNMWYNIENELFY